MRRLIGVGALAVFVWTVLGSVTAWADTVGNAVTDGRGIEHEVSSDLSQVGADGRDNTNPDWPCWWDRLDYPPDATVVLPDGTTLVGDGIGRFYSRTCGGDDGSTDVIYVRPASPQLIAERAWRYLPLPEPRPRFSPGGDHVVNLGSWLWIEPGDWQPLESTVSVPGVSVTVTAVPETLIWDPGDGSVVSCGGPGVPFAATATSLAASCVHTYTRSSASQPGGAYGATVTVLWHATWTAAGAPGGGDLGTIARSVQLDARVGEIQAINTRAS